MCINLVPNYHPLIVGALDLLPEWHHGATWAEDELAGWLRLVETNVRALFAMAPAPTWADVALRIAAHESTPTPPPAKAELESPGPLQVAVELDPAAVLAARLEAELHPSLDELEAEALRPVPPPPSIERRPLSEGGHYSRAGEYVHALHCTFPSTVAGEVCGARCSGEVGMRGHLARGHDLRGDANAARRAELVAAAVANAEAAEAAEALVDGWSAAEAKVRATHAGEARAQEAEYSAGDVERPEPAALDRAALSGLMGPAAAAAAHVELEGRTEPDGDEAPAERLDPVAELRAAAEHSPGAARLLELRRAYLDRVEPTMHKLARFAVAEELGISPITGERWLAEAYATDGDGEPATLDAPAATTPTPERPKP